MGETVSIDTAVKMAATKNAARSNSGKLTALFKAKAELGIDLQCPQGNPEARDPGVLPPDA